jgi:AraC-like DNA-binding protein
MEATGMYKQSFSLLYNPEKCTIPIVNCDYSLNVSCVDLLCEDAVGFPHYHGYEYEICFVLSGTLEIIVDNKWLCLNENEFLLIAPGVHQCPLYKPTVENKYFIMVFNFQKNANTHEKPSKRTISENLMTILQSIKEKKYLLCKDQQDSAHYIDHMLFEVSTNRLGWKSMLYQYYTLFVFSILRNVFTADTEVNQESNANMAMCIIKYMSNNYHKNISLQDVAEANFCSSRHIDRVFKQYFNSSFRDTLTRFRVNYAKNYLVESDFTIDKISELVGFTAPNTLYRQFKELEGISPGQYRKKYRNVSEAFNGT